MTKALIETTLFGKDSPLFIDQLYEVLTSCGYFVGSKAKLAGMTSFAFRFQVDRKLSVNSLYDYDWISEHWLATDFLGIYSKTWCGFVTDPTFLIYRELAMNAIKRSIDKGLSAIIWTGEFEVICGYDDKKKLFLSNKRGIEEEVLYKDFAISAPPYWFCQTFGDRIELWENDYLRESLAQAVNEWESHKNIIPY